MFTVGETCIYYASEETSPIFALIKEIDRTGKRVLIDLLAESGNETWISFSSAFPLTEEQHVISALNVPNSNDVIEELNKSFLLTKMLKAVSLVDDKEMLEEILADIPVRKSPSWSVGDICVCQWSENNEFYYAEVIKIWPNTNRCRVAYLFYENEEDKSMHHLYKYSDSEAQQVMDEDNIRLACERLPYAEKGDSRLYLKIKELTTTLPDETSPPSTISTENVQPQQPTFQSSLNLEEISSQQASAISRSALKVSATTVTTKSEEVRSGVQHPRIVPPHFSLTLPPNWKDLLLADEAPHQALLTSWFMCGYHTGYYEGLKARDKVDQSR